MRIIGIIQARLGSTRLLGKVLAPLQHRPLLGVLHERIHRARIDEWWLATSSEPSDHVTAAWGEELGLRLLRGDSENVLSRFTSVLRQTRSDWFLRITADDPFVDAEIIDRLVERASEVPSKVVVVGEDPARRTLPLGYVPQIARSHAVLDQEQTILQAEPHHRAHVLSWFYDQGAVAFLEPPEGWPERPDWRWTVDTPVDLQMARRAFRMMGADWARATYLDWVRVLDAHPEIASLNQAVEQKNIAEG